MAATDQIPHVLVAVTEASPFDQLWRAALDVMRQSGGELTVLLLQDDRWHRAASLPFTREISWLSGIHSDFTLQRAEELSRSALGRLRDLTTQFAAEAKLNCSIREFAETDASGIRTLVTGRRSIVVAHSLITTLPSYALLKQLDCQIVFVDAEGQPDRASQRDN